MSLLHQPNLKITPLAIYDKITLIAIIREDGTWGGYKSDRYTEVNEVVAKGKPLTREEARQHFWHVAEKGLRYRV